MQNLESYCLKYLVPDKLRSYTPGELYGRIKELCKTQGLVLDQPSSGMLEILKKNFPNQVESRTKIFLTIRLKQHMAGSLWETIISTLSRKDRWYDLWGSKEILFVPADLRRQILSWGIKNNFNELNLEETLDRYDRILECPREGLLRGREDMSREQTLNAHESTSDLSHSPAKERNLKERSSEKRYMSSLDKVKQFLSISSTSQRLIKKLPMDLQPSAISKQLDNHWIPALEMCFGSLESFIFHLSKTKAGKIGLENLLQSGTIDKGLEEAITDEMKTVIIRDWRDDVQQQYNKVGIQVLKGGQTSKAAYKQIRLTTVLESKTDAKERVSEEKSDYVWNIIPKALSDISKLTEKLTKTVEESGGGWAIENWSSPTWINSWLPTPTDKETQRAIDWIRERLQNTDRQLGTHFISMYVKNFEHLRTGVIMDHLKTQLPNIARWRSRKNPSVWQAFVQNHSSVWQNIPDSSFLAYKWMKMFVDKQIRRGFKRVSGIPMPGLQPEDAVEKEVKNKAIGIWATGEPYQHLLPPNKTADLFAKGYYPIGKPFETTVDARTVSGKTVETNKKYKGRWVNLHHCLIYLLTIALAHGLIFIPPSTDKVVLEYGLWLDGATALAHPLLALLVFLIWDPQYSRATLARWNDCLRFYPGCLTVMSETVAGVSKVLGWARDEIVSVTSFRWRNKTWVFKFKMLIGDNSLAQKALATPGGASDCRCHQCETNFSDPSIWSYAQQKKCKQKSLLSILTDLLKSSAEVLGLGDIPALLSDTLQKLKDIDLSKAQWEWVKDFIMGLDALHNIKGHLAKIVQRMRTWSNWDDSLFLELIAAKIGRRYISDFNGSRFRLLFALWEEVLLPPMKNCAQQIRDGMKVMLHWWAEIQWILYLPPEARGDRQIRLRYHVLTWLYFFHCAKFFPNQVKGNIKDPIDIRRFVSSKPPSGATKDVIKTWITELMNKMKISLTLRPSYAKRASMNVSNMNKNWSELDKIELWEMYCILRKELTDESVLDSLSLPSKMQRARVTPPEKQPAETTTKKRKRSNSASATRVTSPPTTTNTTTGTTSIPVEMQSTNTTSTTTASNNIPTRKRKRKKNGEPAIETIMDIYLHSICIHMPQFYEKMDFRNANTERAEGFLAKLKHILADFSNRNLADDQPLREVVVRHAIKGSTADDKDDEGFVRGRIGNSFSNHVFSELAISYANYPPEEVNALLEVLVQNGYTERKDWNRTSTSILFSTIEGTVKLFKQYSVD